MMVYQPFHGVLSPAVFVSAVIFLRTSLFDDRVSLLRELAAAFLVIYETMLEAKRL
jgi:hypothetical protein